MCVHLVKKQVKQKSASQDSGQTIVEIAIIFAIVAAVLMAMSPYMKRTIQGMIKIASDQIGNQAEAEQDFESSYTDRLRVLTRQENLKTTTEQSGVLSYTYGDKTDTETSIVMPLGGMEKAAE